MTEIHFRPEPGSQSQFLATSADIAIYGGRAGVGKSYGLLLETLRHLHRPGFGAVIFRRECPQITNEGGLWDTSQKIYPHLEGRPRETQLDWQFPSGARISFAHMQLERNRYTWDGAQIPLLGFDELFHFTWKQFSYMLARNRTTIGIRPYVRATTNPDPDHWLRRFLAWWIDEETGYAIPERSSKIRWFTLIGNEVEWSDDEDGLRKLHGPEVMAKSCTFIAADRLSRKLVEMNPEYVGSLQALPLVDRERLLHGNWNIRETAGNYFRREWFPIVDAAPRAEKTVRYWDRAATEAKQGNDPSWTAGVKMSRESRGAYCVEHVSRFRSTFGGVQTGIRNTASQDGHGCIVVLEQDPGQAGKVEAQMLARQLSGYVVRLNTVRESKGTRAKPYSAQAEAGNVRLVRGPWNEAFIREHENFDGGTNNQKTDQVDAGSGAFYSLTSTKRAGVWGTR